MAAQFSFNFDANNTNNNNNNEEENNAEEIVELDAKVLIEKMIEQLPEDVQPKVRQVQSLQDEYDKLESEYEKELFQLNLKYEQMYKPIFTKRSEISTTIPNFWRTALENSDLGYEIQEQDKDSLQFLTDVTCESFTGRESENRPHDGFTLSFHFAENPYFNNKVLTQTFYYDSDGSVVETIADGTIIEWKSQDKNLTVQKKSVKPKGKKNKNKKAVQSWVPVPSFYQFFNNRSEDDVEEDDEDEEGAGGLNGDAEFARYIKEQIIPHAVDFFLGIVPQELDAGMFGGEDDDEDEDEEDDGEDVAPKKKAQKSSGAAPQEQPQECKQQ